MGTLDACNGHPLRVERARHNLTQQQLAEAARVGAMTVWRAENGYLINAESRQRLCDYFGKSASELGLLGREEFVSRKVPVPPQTTSLASVSPSVPAVRHSYEARPTSFSPAKALDLLLEAPNQVIGEHMGAWLALGASHLSVLFEAGWTLENILESLRVVMQGMEGMPAVTRRQLLNLSGAVLITGLSVSEGSSTSTEERLLLTSRLGESIAAAWKLFHTADNTQVLAIGQTQMYIVQQSSSYIPAQVRPIFYSAVYRLIGAALYFQGNHTEAYQMQERAYLAALEAGDSWNMAQCRSWQAYGLNALGYYEDALETTNSALRLITSRQDIESVRLRARLLAFSGEQAARLQRKGEAEDKLRASEDLLSYLPDPHEEFDRTGWLRQAGICALYSDQYSIAEKQLRTALEQLPSQWILRSVSTAIPLMLVYVCKKDLNALLPLVRRILPLVQSVQSRMLKLQFAHCLQKEILTTFSADKQCLECVTETLRQLEFV